MRAALKGISYWWCFWTVIPNAANVSSFAFKNSQRNLARDFGRGWWWWKENILSGVLDLNASGYAVCKM